MIAGLYIPQGAIRQSGAGVKTTGQHGASNIPLAYDPRVLRLLSFLTRTQAWLTPPEIAKTFRIDGRPIGVATLYRWFAALEDATGLAYFPYPRMNVLGLQEVTVRIFGLRSPEVLSTVPFSHAFLVELGFDGEAHVSQDYWIPGPALKTFEEYWRSAVDLDLVKKVDILPARNTHFLFSRFESVVRPNGWVEMGEGGDTRYFADLLRRHLQEPFDTRLAEWITETPLLVPLILEHLWGHYSSRHVWQHIQAKGESPLERFRKGLPAKTLRKKGATLRLMQRQWKMLLRRFDSAFLQPVVFLPPQQFPNCILLSLHAQTGSTDRIVELGHGVARHSLVTAVMPELGWGGRCKVWSMTPLANLPSLLRLSQEHRANAEGPSLALSDLEASRRLVEPAFCRFDWSSFDPTALAWTFDGEGHLERLKDMRSKTAVTAGFIPARSKALLQRLGNVHDA